MPHETRHRLVYASFVLVLALVCLLGQRAFAQTCVAGIPMANWDRLNRFRINVASFDALDDVSRDEVVTAAIRGAEVWNELGNAGYFQYLGSTNETLLPARYRDCDEYPISTIVLDENNCDGTRTAAMLPRCEDSDGNFHGWNIVIYKRQGTGGSCFEAPTCRPPSPRCTNFSGPRSCTPRARQPTRVELRCQGLSSRKTLFACRGHTKKVDNRLQDIMKRIHEQCVTYGQNSDHVDYAKGANLGGFVKVADALLAQGIV